MSSAITKLRRRVGDGPLPRSSATHMLEDMLTGEVSIVAAAANKRDFLFLKRRRPPMRLPASAQRDAERGVLDAILLVGKLGEALKRSQVDDTAKVPAEFITQLREAVEALEDAASDIARSAA